MRTGSEKNGIAIPASLEDQKLIRSSQRSTPARFNLIVFQAEDVMASQKGRKREWFL